MIADQSFNEGMNVKCAFGEKKPSGQMAKGKINDSVSTAELEGHRKCG